MKSPSTSEWAAGSVLKEKAWISGPQREYRDCQGNRKFIPLVQFSDALKRGVQQVVLEALKEQA
jgi:hypothetical protein